MTQVVFALVLTAPILAATILALVSDLWEGRRR